MVNTSELMSIKEVAEAKNITVGRVYQLINDGSLKADKIGSHYVIRKSDCDSLVIYGKPGRPQKNTGIEAGKEVKK